jgi:hypothetical protein
VFANIDRSQSVAAQRGFEQGAQAANAIAAGQCAQGHNEGRQLAHYRSYPTQRRRGEAARLDITQQRMTDHVDRDAVLQGDRGGDGGIFAAASMSLPARPLPRKISAS